MKRVLRRFAVIVGAIALAIVAVAASLLMWATLSASGLRFVWDHVAPRLPSGISVESVDGTLAGPVVLGGIALRTETIELRIEHAELRWNPRKLLARTLDIERLDARGVDLVQLPVREPPPAPSEPFRPPERIALPLDIELRSASMEAIRYRSSPETEPLLVERVSAAGRLDGDTLELRELLVRAPLFDVSGAASLVPSGDYETTGRLDWTVRPAGYPEARGSARIAGNLEALAIEQRVEAPYDISANVRVLEPLTALRLDGDVELTIRPAALGIEQRQLDTVSSTLWLHGTPRELELTGRVELAGGDADGLTADVVALYAGGALEIRALDVLETTSGAKIHASGRVNAGERPLLELSAKWSRLQWPLRAKPQVVSEAGSLELRGTLDEYTVALDAHMALADGTAGRVSASGAGDTNALALERIDVEAFRGRIAGRANVSWAPTLTGAVDLAATELDPGTLLPKWPGRLNARVRASAALEDEALTAAVQELTVDGALRERAIALNARGSYAAKALRIDALTLRAGSTEVSAGGTAGPKLALEWRIDSPDLGDLSNDLAGRLVANGQLDGPRERPRIGVDAQGDELRFMGSAIDVLELSADVDIAGNSQSSLTLAASSARMQGTEVEHLQLMAAGNAARHELVLSTTTGASSAELELTGSVADPWKRGFVWSFEVGTATLAYTKLAPWQLREPASGRVTRTDAELARACWQSGMADLCVEGKRGRDRTTAQFALSQLPFAYFAALLAEPVQLDGDMSLAGTFEQSANGAPHADARLQTSLGRLVPADEADNAGEAPYALSFGPADGHVTLNDDRLEGLLHVPFAEDGALEASVRVGTGGVPFAQRTLDGQLSLDIASLEFVADLVTQLTNTQGTVNGDLRVSGTVGSPEIAGRLALADGKATVPETNVELEGLSVELAGDGASGLTVGAQARSGGGSVAAEGRLALTEAGPEGQISVDGDAFEVVDTVDAQIVVSPDLDLTLAHDSVELTGAVMVPRARLTPRDTGEAAVSASRDQVIVASGDEEEDRTLARPFSAKVQLRLGDEVEVDGYGLTGRLGGAIEIAERPGEPTTGTGELRIVDGVYEAYGQKLEIETGRVVFAGGPIAEPGVDIEAVRHPTEDITVGARVRGPLAAPELSVFSEPPMPQQEQLSYLVLGRGLEDASESESSAMSRAALALGLKGGNFVSERINENLGLDAFGIETDSNESASEASFVIGKYLTPSLYMSYGIGLLEPVNTLKLRYEISKRWRLVTESSSEASGGDLIYNIERGR
jgi:translocation and assembly module TamB